MFELILLAVLHVLDFRPRAGYARTTLSQWPGPGLESAGEEGNRSTPETEEEEELWQG